MMVYTSLENSKIKELKKLQKKKYRDATGLFLVEGEHLVLEAYKAGLLKTLILEENTFYPLSIDTISVSSSVLTHLSLLEHAQPVMGVCRKKKEEEIQGNVMMLEDIQDPGNLGTIIRSAVAFHIDTLILSPSTVDPYNEKVLRATQGLNFHLNILQQDLKEAILTLKEKKYQIIGTRVTHGKNIKQLKEIQPFALIMGNEGKGMSDAILELCDEVVYIDMDSRCESLNVGVAASILMHDLDK